MKDAVMINGLDKSCGVTVLLAKEDETNRLLDARGMQVLQISPQ